MAVRLHDQARGITVEVPTLRRAGPADHGEVSQLWCAGLSVELIAVMTELPEKVVRQWLPFPDPRFDPNVELRHTERTHAVMRRWHRNTITLAELISELRSGAGAPVRPRPSAVRMANPHSDRLRASG